MAREMKDSGIAWIGLIPSKWQVLPHKRVMKKVKDIQEHYQGEDIISLTMNGVIVRDLDAGGKMPASFDGYQKVYPGNLLQCLFDIDVTPRCVGLIKNKGVSSPAYSQFKMLSGADSSYYDYLLRYMDDYKTLLHLSKNLRSSLTETDFGQILTILPPFSEQQRIAAYLDEKCADIDNLVSVEEGMIEELQAYKQSVITEAVTKGLDSDVPMKDSGVEWISSIPATWAVEPLKANVEFGKGLPITKEDLREEGEPVISYGQIHAKFNTGTTTHPELLRFVSSSFVETNSQSLTKRGDFIFADTSEDTGGCGNCVYIDTDYPIFAGYHTIIAHPKNKKIGKYFAYLFRTDYWRNQIRCRVAGIKLFSITLKILAHNTVIIPPAQEQQRIAAYLDEKCADIDDLIAIKRQKIEELKEYKKSLIYEAVTGKIDLSA